MRASSRTRMERIEGEGTGSVFFFVFPFVKLSTYVSFRPPSRP